MSTSGGYHESIGDTMSTSGMFSTSAGYHEYIRRCSVNRGFQYKSKAFTNLLCHMNHDIPPMHSWYPPDVLNTPRCTEHTLYRVAIINRSAMSSVEFS